MIRSFGAVAILAVLVVAGILAGGLGRVEGRYPDGCRRFDYPARRCAALVARAIETAGVDRASISAIDLTRLPRDPNVALLSPYEVVTVGLHLASGAVISEDVACVGVGAQLDDPGCSDDARIQLFARVDADVPCSGDPPAGCATMPPTPRPESVTGAHALHVPALDVPIDHAGHYEIPVGKATLADGYLQAASLRLADAQPEDFWIPRGRLEIRPDLAGRPPVGNRYRDPFDGPEPVSVFLVFDVTLYVGPATLQVRDIVVE